MTPMPASPFLNSGTPPSPAVPDTAAADQVAPQVAAAEPFQSSCGNGESRTVPIGPQASAPRRSKELIGDAGVAPSPHEAIPSNEGRPSEAPAPRCTEPHDGAGVLADRIDWHEFFEAVMDERIVLFELYDEVPLFIRSGDHLRRWEA